MGKQKVTDGGGEAKPKLKKENVQKQEQSNIKTKKQKQNGTRDANELPAKKRKLSNNQEKQKEDDKKLGIKKDIFTIFSKLQDKNQRNNQKNIKELITLLQYEYGAKVLTATSAYALKRLIRCTGADDKETVVLNAGAINSVVRQVPGIDLMDLLDIMKRELPVGSQQKGKEESLAAIGQLLTSFAIIQSQYFENPSAELIEAIYHILVSHLKGREYLVTMCGDIMADSFKQVKAASFESNVWPLLKSELNKPITLLRLHECDLLLAIHLSYPELLTLQHLEKSLWLKANPQYEQLYELYDSTASIQSDGVYARLGKFLARDEHLLNTWVEHLYKKLPAKLSSTKIYIISTLTHLLLHYKEQGNQPLDRLFQMEPLVPMLIKELSTAKQLQGKGKSKPAQLQLRIVCRKFETALLLSFDRCLKQDTSKLIILKRLLRQQPDLDNVMKTPRFTQQLLQKFGKQGIKDMYKYYKSQLTSKEEQQSKNQQENYLKHMQLLLQLTPQVEQRTKQLYFLLQTAVFHMNQDKQPCTAAEAAPYSRQCASRCEEIFFSVLLHKLGRKQEHLTELVEQLRSLLLPLTKQLATSEAEKLKFRGQQTQELQHIWQQVQLQLEQTASGKDQSSLALIFDVLILFLALASYAPSCTVSIELLKDLFICQQHALKPKWSKSRKSQAADELRWQDVLTDVLLQLLLQTGHFWRDFVIAIGTALMPHLGRANLEQLLITLDMSKNPLGEQESDNEEEDADDGEEDADDGEEDADDGEEEEDSSDEEEDEEEEDAENNTTTLETIRENVRLALLQNDDEVNDASSVDWNDVNEEQGERLNQALERAFLAFKLKSNSNKTQSKRLTKSERISSTALLHFRIRVLDLVELLVQEKPQLEILLDALSSVYHVYRVSSQDVKLQPLAEASKKLLRKMTINKISLDKDQDKRPIVECIKEFMSQDKAGALPEQNIKGSLAEWRNKCVVFLVSHFNEPVVTSTPVWELLQTYLNDWVIRRRSPHTLATFDALFASPWIGNLQLAISFSSFLTVEKDLRKIRRIQILELLLKHARLISLTLTNNAKAAKELKKFLLKYEPIGSKDTKLHNKLLTQLQISSKENV